MDKRTGWLAGLSIGDTVGVRVRAPMGDVVRIGRITAISATGRFTVTGKIGDQVFAPNGRQVDGSAFLEDADITRATIRQANARGALLAAIGALTESCRDIGVHNGWTAERCDEVRMAVEAAVAAARG